MRPRDRSNRTHDERGSAGAVLTVGMGLAVATVFCVAALLIHWFAVARQAEQAAELAALGGAGAAVDGQPPCSAAERVAVANGSRVVACVVHGTGRDVVVEISVAAAVESSLPGVPAEVVRSATASSF